jgi:rod shape-determining protein MreD
MGVFLALPFLTLAAILQAVLLPNLSLVGGGPNLVYLVVIAWALNAPLEQGVAWAIIGGLLTDLLSAVPLGTSSLGLMLSVFAMNLLLAQFYELTLLLLLLMGLFGTFAYELLRLMLLDAFHLLGYIAADAPFVITWGDDITNVIGPIMVYNVVLILPIYGLIRRFQRRLPSNES